MQTDSSIASLRGVTKRYGKVLALDEIDLEIHRGQVLAMLGPNGAGKTTAIGLLLGLIRPDSGEARLFGQVPHSRSARVRTGVMLQSAEAPETMKVGEQIDLFRSYYPDPLPAGRILELARLDHLESRTLRALSGGEKQRLMFALAICGNPELLFLDEPTVGMDVEMRRGLWGAILSFAHEGRTVVLTTHYLEEADALASRIAVIRNGSVIADGTPAEIKSRVAARKISCRTTLASGEILSLRGVQSVEIHDANAKVLSVTPEETVRQLLDRDRTLAGLEVTGASLEEAFLAMTNEEEVAA